MQKKSWYGCFIQVPESIQEVYIEYDMMKENSWRRYASHNLFYLEEILNLCVLCNCEFVYLDADEAQVLRAFGLDEGSKTIDVIPWKKLDKK